MKLTFPNIGGADVFVQTLKAICGDPSGKSLLDVCCGYAPLTRMLGFQDKTFVDVVDRNLAEENPNFIVSDVFDFFSKNERVYDVITATDCIEHFPKAEAHLLLMKMVMASDKQIIFTPLGDYLIEKEKTNDPDSHKSGWVPNEFDNGDWATVSFPDFHPTINIGAFFAWRCKAIESDFERVKNELKF